MGNNNQVLKYITNILKVWGALFCLYCFICSLDILSTAFKLLAGQATGKKICFRYFLLRSRNMQFQGFKLRKHLNFRAKNQVEKFSSLSFMNPIFLKKF